MLDITINLLKECNLVNHEYTHEGSELDFDIYSFLESLPTSSGKAKPNPDFKTLCAQWISFAMNYRMNQALTSSIAINLLKPLNDTLGKKLFIASSDVSVADVFLYVYLKDIIASQSNLQPVMNVAKHVMRVQRKLEDMQLTTSFSKVSLDVPADAAPKVKPVKEKKAVAAPTEPEAVLNFSKANLQVCKVVECINHPESEKLLICKLQVAGESEPRTLVTGLAHYYTAEQMTNKLVVAIINLKPAKLAGIESCAMICAGSAVENGAEVVKILETPQNSEVGDQIFIENYESVVDNAGRCNDKTWKKIVAVFTAQEGVACVDNLKLVTKKGEVHCQLPNGSEIH